MSRNSNGSGEWVLGYLHGESGVDPDSFGVCIGLQDQNGKKAFTGDITQTSKGSFWVVVVCEDGYGLCSLSQWMLKDRIEDFQFICEPLLDPRDANWFKELHEIVGSVYDQDLQPFMGNNQSSEDIARVHEILRQRAEKVPLDAVIQKCEERNKDGGKGVSCPSVELDR